jgi:hypothetical protein
VALETTQMLPVPFDIVTASLSPRTSISDRVGSGSIIESGELKWVTCSGAPIGWARSGSIRTFQRLKYPVGFLEMKYNIRPSGAQRGLSGHS